MARTPPPSPAAPEPGAAAASRGGHEDAPAGLPPLPGRYEEALAELESLVARMEAGALPLEELLVHYRRGAQLLAFCRGRLDAVEAQVKVLEDGQLKPWEDG